MIKAPYNNINGLWKVTTEGDCEGRSIRDLGIYRGNIDEIAFALADKCTYALTFSAITHGELDMSPKCKTVDIKLNISSGTWDMSSTTRAAEVGQLFKNRPVAVGESNYYGCVRLSTTKKTVAEKRADALAKLTPEERKLLGLL